MHIEGSYIGSMIKIAGQLCTGNRQLEVLIPDLTFHLFTESSKSEFIGQMKPDMRDNQL
ncbi:hypothetical protein ACJVDH_10985 [Pedobacter sp. AW1-32]|uniref:hypothetical protein n=1 Tax=Pedobacter sp. AW1-32 TaxID=3383026 RepID=UPI003FEFC3C7